MAAQPLSYTDETWKPVEGFNGRYEVSDLGRVRSYDAARFMEAVLAGHEPPKMIRALHTASNGYKTISFTIGGVTKTVHIHVLVCLTFLGPRPDGYHAGHRNGDKEDNRLANLRWVTPAENNADKLLHGTHGRGARHPGARLCEEDVRAIRLRLKAGETAAAIAAGYPVGRSLIQRIGVGKAWAWLT